MEAKHAMDGKPVGEARLLVRDAKWSFTTRRVDPADVAAVDADLTGALPGDLVLASVVEVGQHKRVQLAAGRASDLYPGDRLVLALGHRYAPDQFEGLAALDDVAADLVAAGGIVGRVVAANARMAPPTRLQPVGVLIGARGRSLNVADYALPARSRPTGVAAIAVVGASMNAGKTTAAVSLAHGLRRAGHRVAGIKATGTGAFGDLHAFLDAGVPAFDFVDAGMATTYRMPVGRVVAGLDTLIGTAAEAGADVVVVELADGVFQDETAALLRDPAVRARFAGIMFAAPDALSAVGGTRVLAELGLQPFAVSGLVTLSPLAMREAAAATGCRFLSREQLRDPVEATAVTAAILGTVRPGRAAAA